MALDLLFVENEGRIPFELGEIRERLKCSTSITNIDGAYILLNAGTPFNAAVVNPLVDGWGNLYAGVRLMGDLKRKVIPVIFADYIGNLKQVLKWGTFPVKHYYDIRHTAPYNIDTLIEQINIIKLPEYSSERTEIIKKK